MIQNIHKFLGLLLLYLILRCHGEQQPPAQTLLDPQNIHPTEESALLLNLKNILTIAHDDHDHHDYDQTNLTEFPNNNQTNHPIILLSRKKRIIITPQYNNPYDNVDNSHNSIYDDYHSSSSSSSSKIYVTEDGEDADKSSSRGPWSHWSGSSECSRSCGGGVAQLDRVCEEDPPPLTDAESSSSSSSSSACEGPKSKFTSCNTHACGGLVATASSDFRAEQCSAYNNVPFEGRFYTWLPYTRAPNKCELNCMPQGERFYYRHKRKVIDGTTCGVDLICVNGNCLPVGCDGILGSRKRQDKCRVCGGDGSSCNTVQGVFDSNDLQVGYNDVLLIPAGATNILVRETQATNNYLAIRNTSGHYYLNGNWRIDFPREIPIASTTFHYERKPQTFFAPETIRALGPISEAIYVVILYQESNPGITFEYSVPRGVVVETPEGTEYAWIYDEWGECSRDCGGGTQNRNVNCARRSDATLNWDYVEPHLCDSALKPETFRYCNYEIPCPVRWHISTWDECTAPCGSNITGTQIRNVFCEQEIQGVSALVENEKCVESHGLAPEKLRNCTSTKTDECTDWFVGEWKGCSSLCGDGYDTRVVRCVSKDELGRVVIHGDEKCGGGEKPKEYEYCFKGPCDGVDWVVEGSWGECKVPSTPTCNSPSSAAMGTQSREVYCSDSKGKVYEEKYCHDYRKPNTTQPCELDFNPAEDNSCKFSWFATQWSECEFQSCSEGIRGKMRRKVYCGTVIAEDGKGMELVDEDKCNATKKYGDVQDCNLGYDVVDKECGDEEARLRKGRWFGGPWGECSKRCGGGRRTRAVLCMVGNRTTTDVKICGEDGLLFTSDECNTGGCDDLEMMTTEDPTMMIEEEEVTDDGGGVSMSTEEPCEPLDDYDYEILWEEEEERRRASAAADDDEEAMEVDTSTGRSVRSVGTTTEMMAEEDDESTTGVTMETMATEDSMVTEETSSDHVSMVTGGSTEASGETAASANDDDSMGSTESGAVGSGATMTTTSGKSDGTTVSGGDMMTTTTMASEEMKTTSQPPPSSTSTEPPTTTTTEPPTTTSTTTEEPSTTAAETTTTTTMMAETTTVGMETTTVGVVTTTTAAAAAAEGSTTVMSGSSEEAALSGMTTTVIISDVTMTTTGSVGGSSPTTEGSIYDDIENPPLRMVDSSSTTMRPGDEDYSDSTGDSSGGTGMMEELDYGMATEVEYVTDEEVVTEPEVTTLPTVTLPKCKPRPSTPKPPTNCHNSKFGCCPDNYAVATGPFHEGCKIAKSCGETEFGCCDDGVRVAENKFKRNCAVECKSTLFGCCKDGKTVALGNSEEGCVKDCNETEFGCCLDGKTAKRRKEGRNCPKIPCTEAIYGCCPDKKTPAEGHNYDGCKEINLKNCKANFFGCCIDGTTSALGPNEEGCPDTPPCARTTHGCCPDGITSAHGPNNEGCCASSRFGCCPDNINEAKGFDFEGCDCKTSAYGCCPDDVTPARGPNKDCGCKFTEHGCCPDGVSIATGQSNEGCGCSTFQHGCCPDGVSVAKGPNKQGCGCAYTEFGCCPDSRTAKNSSSEDCGCEASAHGCCPDGVRPANGDDFEGCEDVPIKPGEVCGLEKERGSCRNFTVRWFFDMQYGGCSRFWWGGCEGNRNRFGSQDECKSVCVEPEGRDACFLPRVSGPCEGYYPSWHYDPQRESCEQFVYSGCLGNNNRFGSRQECENQCLQPERVDDCDQPRTEGPCRGNYSRWAYDKTTEKCELFTYGGCKGNSNNFLTQKECHQRCGKDIRMRDVCFQPRSEGPCNEKLPRWYYDRGEQRCVPFYYSGCQGNSNRFGGLDECEKTCPAALLGEDREGSGGCLEELVVGDCASYTERFYFDRYEGKCKSFIYSGCHGNSNNFIHIDDCRSKCESSVPRRVPSSEDQQFSQAQCFLPPPDDPNSCAPNAQQPPTIRWYYDNHDGVCYQFRYYCSNSSLNNFDTRQDCEDKCGGSQDFCNLPVVTGPCSGRFLQFYYERESDSCVSFEYSGCSGNGNRFDTVVQCEQRCKKGTDHPGGGPVDDVEEERRRVYEEERRRHQEEAEDERRRAQDEEEDRRRREEYEEEINRRRQEQDLGGRSSLSQEQICVLDVDVGPCRASVPAFHFDTRTGRCVQFVYGGCGGNANRFESEEMCERQCGAFRGQDVCNLTPDPGPCTSDTQKSQKWYFNTNDQACAIFMYSGCDGNGNRFSSREECESVCYSRNEIISGNDTITGAAICRLPPDTGPCVDGFKRWYYSQEEHTCIPFVFGGCAGNLNRFKSFSTCVGFCEKALGAYGSNNGAMVRSGDENNSGGGGSSHQYYSDDNNSAPCDCSYIKCPYGLTPQNSTYSCICECHDPCRTTYCPDPSSRCAVDILQNHGTSSTSLFVPVCRSVRKPGNCPATTTTTTTHHNHHHRQQQHHHTRHHHHHHHGDRICDNECSTDADCSGDLKCCVLDCGSSCVVAMGTSHHDHHHQEEVEDNSLVIRAINNFANVSEGGLVEIECVARSNTGVRVDVIWGKVDSNEKITGESGRFRITEHSITQSSLTSKLQIVGPMLSDEGTYECIGSIPNHPPQSDRISVRIHETSVVNPAAVLEDPTLPTTQVVSLGMTAGLRCFALGWPRPSVTWWRGERMLPFSSERYEQMRDYSLVVRLVGLRDLGVYTCQAYNGLGRAASWSVSLLTVGPVEVRDVEEEREYLVYVVDGGGGRNVSRLGGGGITTTTTTTTTTEKYIAPTYYVPVRATISSDRSHYNTAQDIRINCDVEGYPAPSISWFKGDVQIDPYDLRLRIEQSTLTIPDASPSDSGTYRCEATNDYDTATSVPYPITVSEATNLHVNCTDNSFFANCKLIVKANYCTNKYYARFCCKSCTLAGQLPQYGPHLQEAGQSYFRRPGGGGGLSSSSSSSNNNNNQFNSNFNSNNKYLEGGDNYNSNNGGYYNQLFN